MVARMMSFKNTTHSLADEMNEFFISVSAQSWRNIHMKTLLNEHM